MTRQTVQVCQGLPDLSEVSGISCIFLLSLVLLSSLAAVLVIGLRHHVSDGKLLL